MTTPLEVARDAALEQFRSWLQANQQPATPQRMAIARVVLGADGALSAEETVERLRAQGPAPGVATVYRTIDLLVACGLAREEDRHEGFRRFRPLRGDSSFEELLCTSCGRVTAVTGSVDAASVAAAADAAGFVPVRHRLTIYGLCGECGRARNPEGGDGRAPRAWGR
ncbi:MAG: transcriptional repressor [Gemmatimonadota bacterium]|nr:transcriptional repressor [Gemmatimonadota bacterium]